MQMDEINQETLFICLVSQCSHLVKIQQLCSEVAERTQIYLEFMTIGTPII